MRHRAVLGALEERRHEDPDRVIAQLAYHSLQARELAAAGRYARLAGERAARLGAHRETVAHYETVLELLEPDDDEERAAVYERLGHAAYPLGDTALYLRYWREAQRLYRALGEGRKVAEIEVWLARTHWERGDTRGAFANVTAALRALEGVPEGRERDAALARAYLAHSQLYMLSAHPRDSIAWGERAIRLAEALGDAEIVAEAVNNIGCALLELGEIERGLAELERSLELGKRSGAAVAASRAYHNLAQSLAYLGEFDRADAMFREASDLSDRGGVKLHRGLGHGSLGRLEMLLGHWPRAHEFFDAALRAGDLGLPVSRLYAVPWKGELLYREGRLEEARALLEEFLPEYREAGEFRILRDLLPTLARVSLARGDVGDREIAAGLLDECVALWRETEARVTCWDMLGAGVEVYLALGRTADARELLDALRPLAERAGSRLAHARHADALGLVARHEGRHPDAAARFADAAALWRAMGTPFEEGRSRRRRAECLLEEGADRAVASAELDRARELFERLGAPPDLARTEDLARRHGLVGRTRVGERAGPLTPRERQVIALVARGLSNREIAEELVVSGRTAEVHISNILGKLGFTSRGQAAAYAVEQGLAPPPPLPHLRTARPPTYHPAPKIRARAARNYVVPQMPQRRATATLE